MPATITIDDGAPGYWRDALGWLPWIEDGEGCLFNEAFNNARRDCAEGLCIEPGCGQPAGTICTMSLCPGKRRSLAPFHSQPNSAGRR